VAQPPPPDTPITQFAYLERVIEERERIYTERFAALRALMDERDRLYGQSFKAAEVAVVSALAAQEKAVSAAFMASEKAIVKAEQAQKEYNERSNEFRGQLADQAVTLMPRPETMSMFKAVEEKVSAAQSGLDIRIATLQESSKRELEASRTAFEKALDTQAAAIQSLRELHAQGSGKEQAVTQNQGQTNWLIGLFVSAMLGAVGLAMSIYNAVRVTAVAR
jgi:hypothetical protein